MKKVLKFGGIGLGILIVLSIIGSLASPSKTEKSTNSTDSNTNETTQQVEKKAEQESMKIKASELADDFDANQVAAEAKWKDKLVEFSSEITNITESGLSFGKVSSKEFSMTQISCRTNNKDQLLSVKNGETVIVKGIVGSQTIGVIDVKDCEIVK